MNAFRHRAMEPELMDDTSLGPAVLQAVLRDIDFANSALGGYQITLKAISRIIEQHPQRTYRILDVGCGDGAMLRKIAHYCKSKKYKVKLFGIDLSDTSIHLAREQSHASPEIRYFADDFLKVDPHKYQADIVLCTLTLHHIPSSQVPHFLRQLVQAAQLAVVVNDLQRSSWAYYLFKVFSSIFIKTYIARHDGLISIKKGFKKRELAQFADQIQNISYKIAGKWAFRYLFALYPEKKLNHE